MDTKTTPRSNLVRNSPTTSSLKLRRRREGSSDDKVSISTFLCDDCSKKLDHFKCYYWQNWSAFWSIHLENVEIGLVDLEEDAAPAQRWLHAMDEQDPTTSTTTATANHSNPTGLHCPRTRQVKAFSNCQGCSA